MFFKAKSTVHVVQGSVVHYVPRVTNFNYYIIDLKREVYINKYISHNFLPLRDIKIVSREKNIAFEGVFEITELTLKVYNI